MESQEFNNIVNILVWTKDLFLLSSTCMTLLDIARSPYGHLHLMEALARTQKQHNFKHTTHPFLCAMRLLHTLMSDTRAVRICSVSSLALLRALLPLTEAAL
jgi:hypothetical protein